MACTKDIALPLSVVSCQRRAYAQAVALCCWKEGRVPLEKARGDREEPLFKKYYKRRHHCVIASLLVIGALRTPFA